MQIKKFGNDIQIPFTLAKYQRFCIVILSAISYYTKKTKKQQQREYKFINRMILQAANVSMQ